MIGRIIPSSSLNSFSSLCYCLMTLGIHVYSSYTAIGRYNEAESRAWPGGKGTPTEVALLLSLTVVSLVILPVFCVTCIFKVGNLANDGVKLGRDHALGCQQLATPTEGEVKHQGMKRVWRHLCPVSQTLHLVASFLLLLPEMLLTAVEVKYGYKSADKAWSSHLDFLFPPERALLSEIRSTVNISLYSNATHVILPTPRVPSEGWSEHISISITFVNFCLALTSFLVRYASVFWYTNKILTLVFSSQLLAMVINSVFSFNSFATLYCICYNLRLYPNVSLALSCSVDLVLYLIGSTILMLSTMTVFEYGSHYFHEKFKVIERHHNPESYVKQTMIVNSGCQGYVPHSCAMAALVVFAVCKGPLLYDLVSLMRLTGDELLLTGIVCEVCYMVLWLGLWFGLTVKQQWQFRILDYVALRQPLYAMPDSLEVRPTQQGQGDGTLTDSLTRSKRLSGRDFPQRYMESVLAPGHRDHNQDMGQSDLGTEDSDIINTAADMALDLDGQPMVEGDGSVRRSRQRRNGGQRVTFDEPNRGQGCQDTNHVHVTADVHSSTPSSTDSSNESAVPEVVMRRHVTAGPDNAEYRNSIRSKCGEYFIPSGPGTHGPDKEEVGQEVGACQEPLPTLMSSFRDKVRESSLAASNFRERERHMLESFEYVDPLPPPLIDDLPGQEVDKRRCIAISDEDLGDVAYRLPNLVSDGPYSVDKGQDHHRTAVSGEQGYPGTDGANISGYKYDSTGSSSLNRRQQQQQQQQHKAPAPPLSVHNSSSLSGDSGHRSSWTNTTLESCDLGLAEAQRSRSSSGGGGGMTRPQDHSHQHQQPRSYYQPQPHKQQQQHQGQHSAVVSEREPARVSSKPFPPRVLHALLGGKLDIGRRDSANYSLTSQDTSSNDSDHGQALCSQV